MAAALALGGCATQKDGVPDPVTRHEIVAGLQTGQTRLGCELTCAGSWSLARASLQGLHANGLWHDLATEVTRIGFNTDLAYFYLARAAEGLGHGPAAETFYRLALASARKCDGMLFDSCDGINVNEQANAALARLSGRLPGAVPGRAPDSPA